MDYRTPRCADDEVCEVCVKQAQQRAAVLDVVIRPGEYRLFPLASEGRSGSTGAPWWVGSYATCTLAAMQLRHLTGDG